MICVSTLDTEKSKVCNAYLIDALGEFARFDHQVLQVVVRDIQVQADEQVTHGDRHRDDPAESLKPSREQWRSEYCRRHRELLCVFSSRVKNGGFAQFFSQGVKGYATYKLINNYLSYAPAMEPFK